MNWKKDAIKDRVGRVEDKAFSYSYLAYLYEKKGMLDEAITNCFKSVEIEPDNFDSYSTLGRIFFVQGKNDKAVEFLSKSLDIKPNNANTHNTMGAALGRQGKFDQAIVHFTEALRCGRQGRLDDSILCFEEALLMKPDFAEAKRKLEYALAQKTRLNNTTSPSPGQAPAEE
jgi:tetratricopeptide (TPR) repeat protein